MNNPIKIKIIIILHIDSKIKDTKRVNAEKRRVKYENKNAGGYELLYPSDDKDDMQRYAKYSKEALKIWEKFTGSYKPKDTPAKQNTPKITKKGNKGSTSSIATTNRTSKKSSVRLSFGRSNNSKTTAKKLKKMPTEKIGIECEDAPLNNYDKVSVKFSSGLESVQSMSTAKNTLPAAPGPHPDISESKYTLERNNSSSSLCQNNKYELSMRKNFEDYKRDTNRSSNTLIKRRENQFQSIGRPSQKARYNILGPNSNFTNPGRILPQLPNNSDKLSRGHAAWGSKPEASKWYDF